MKFIWNPQALIYLFLALGAWLQLSILVSGYTVFHDDVWAHSLINDDSSRVTLREASSCTAEHGALSTLTKRDKDEERCGLTFPTKEAWDAGKNRTVIAWM